MWVVGIRQRRLSSYPGTTDRGRDSPGPFDLAPEEHGCHRGLFLHVFFTILSNFKTFFLSFHMLTIHEQQDKTQENIVLVQRNKHRLHCTQDGLPQDGLTASSDRLVILGDTWTPTTTSNTVQVFYPRLSLLIPLPEDELSSEVLFLGTIGGGIKISPT